MWLKKKRKDLLIHAFAGACMLAGVGKTQSQAQMNSSLCIPGVDHGGLPASRILAPIIN